MLWLPQHRLPHQPHDSGIHTLNPHACNLRTSKIEKRKKPEVTYPFEFVTSGGAVCSTAHGARGGVWFHDIVPLCLTTSFRPARP